MPWWGIMILCVVSFYAGASAAAMMIVARDRRVCDKHHEADLPGL